MESILRGSLNYNLKLWWSFLATTILMLSSQSLWAQTFFMVSNDKGIDELNLILCDTSTLTQPTLGMPTEEIAILPDGRLISVLRNASQKSLPLMPIIWDDLLIYPTVESMVDHDNMELNLFKYDADNHTYLTLNPNNLGNLGVWYLGLIIPAGYGVHSVTYPIHNGDKEILQWKYDANINELVISWIDMDLIEVSDKEIKISLEVNNTSQPITDISLSSDSKWNLGFGNDSKTYSLSVNLINKTDMSEHSQFYYKDDRLWRKPDQSVGRSDMIEVISMNGQSYFKGPIESSISLGVPPGIYIVRSTNSKSTQKVVVW